MCVKNIFRPVFPEISTRNILFQVFVDTPSNIGKTYTATSGKSFTVSKIDNFEYIDPIDKSVTKNQGIRIFFEDGFSLFSGYGKDKPLPRFEMRVESCNSLVKMVCRCYQLVTTQMQQTRKVTT